MLRIPTTRKMVRIINVYTMMLFLLLAVSIQAEAQTTTTTGQTVESGKFRLHKFQQAIGEETYEITRSGDSLLVKSNFKFTDRGSPVPLTTTLKTKQNLTPESFEIKGQTARSSTIDTTVEINGSSANIREGKETRQASVPAKFFTISGYSPTVVQQMMMRYLIANKIKGSLPILPGGELTVEKRGTDTIEIAGTKHQLDRYIISGLIWGRVSLWMDSKQNLTALVCVDAEFDHFESIREGFEPALTTFIDKAAADGMAALAEVSNRISPLQKGALVIINANVIDGTGKAPLSNAAIVVENGRISSVGPSGSVKIPKGAKVLDAQGKYILPGLWDMHAHFEQVEWGPVYLAAGVTTVRDVGNELEFMTSVRDAVKEGRGLGPRILLAGIVDGNGPYALGVIRANTPEEARAVVNRYYKAGFNQIKIYSSIKPEILKEICAEAHRLGLTVTGHIPNGMNAIQAVEAGMDQINHAHFLRAVLYPKDFKPTPGVLPIIDVNLPETKQAIQFFKDHKTVFDPTIALMEMNTHPTETPLSTYEPGAAKLPRELYGPINNTGAPPDRAANSQIIFNMVLSIVSTLHKEGLTIVAGTDQAVPGHSLHREMELYVKAGFTPMEAIQAATIVPARVMKMDKDSGTVEPGKLADLVLVEGNPLDKISNTRNTKFVVAGGRLYDCAQLWQSVGFKP